MTTSSVVAALMLHNQTCSHCRMGEPCLVAERIQDDWFLAVAPAQPAAPAEPSRWPESDAA